MAPHMAAYQQAASVAGVPSAPSAPPAGAMYDEDDGVPEEFVCPLTLEVGPKGSRSTQNCFVKGEHWREFVRSLPMCEKAANCPLHDVTLTSFQT